ncbi:hypothetical protein KAJ27_22675 [bacterium]|nr:hypothetical protein [bacterium]
MNNPKRKINLIYLDKWNLSNIEYTFDGNKIIKNKKNIAGKTDVSEKLTDPIIDGNFHNWTLNESLLKKQLGLLDLKSMETTENYLILPANFFYIFFFQLDRIYSQSEGDEYVKWRILKNLPTELASKIEFDYQLVKKDETIEDPIYTFLVSAINSSILRDISKVFFNHDVRLEGITNDCIEWINILDIVDSPGHQGLMVIDDSYTSLFFQNNGIIEYYRNFDIGTDHIKKNIEQFSEGNEQLDAVSFFESAISVGDDNMIDLQLVKRVLGEWTAKFQQSIDSMRQEYHLKANDIEFYCVSRNFESKSMLKFLENIFSLKFKMWNDIDLDGYFIEPKKVELDVSDAFMLSELGEINEN